MPVAFHRLKVIDVRPETAEAVSVAFAVPPEFSDDYRFEPGQHLTLKTVLEGAEARRSYSICSGADDGELRVAVKKVDGGKFSTFVNEVIRPGDEIDVMTPQGRFGITPDPQAARTYLAIAAGSGITPVMSLMRTMLAREPLSRFVLLYGNRTAHSILFKEAIEDLKDRYLDRLGVYHVLSRERQEVSLLNGRIDAEKIEALLRAVLPAELIDEVFLCGPSGLIEECKAVLSRARLPAERLHVEYFTIEGVAEPRPARRANTRESTTPAATVRVRLHGSEHLVPLLAGETIVEAGLRHGLEMPYSCRGGMCCTCRARLTDGDVVMDQNYSLEPWEIEAGYVLTCQSRPTTQMVGIDYDAS